MNQIKISVSELVYLLYFFILFGSRSVGIYEGGTAYKLVLACGILMYVLKELLTVKTAAEHMVSLLLLSAAVLVYANTGEKGLLLYFTMMLGMKNVSRENVLRLGAAILAIAMPVMALTAMLGLQEQQHNTFYRAGMGYVNRYSWGYPGPNVTHTTFIILLACVICLAEAASARQRICLAAVMAMASLYVFMYTFSYTGMIGCAVLIGGYLYLHARKRLHVIEKGLALLAYPVIGAFSVGIPLLTSEELFRKLDRFLHNRMNYSRYYLTTEPVTLFGTRFGTAPMDDYYVDSAYIYSFLQLGIVPCLILTGLFVWLVWDCLRRDARNELAVIMTFCVIGLSDPFLYNLAYKNVMFIWYGDLLYRTLREAEWAKKGVLGRQIRIPGNQLGERVAVVQGKWLDHLMRAKRRVRDGWNKNCVMLTCGFALLFTAVLIVLIQAFGVKQIDGRFDMPEEWLIFYRYMNTSIVTAAVFLGIIGIGRSRYAAGKRQSG